MNDLFACGDVRCPGQICLERGKVVEFAGPRKIRGANIYRSMKYVMRRPAVTVEIPDCVSAVLLVVYGKRLSAQHRQSKPLSAEGEVVAAPRTGAAAYQGRGLISTPPAPCRAIDEGVGEAPCVTALFRSGVGTCLFSTRPRKSSVAGVGMSSGRSLCRNHVQTEYLLILKVG